MNKCVVLSDEAIQETILELNNWYIQDGFICRDFKLKNFHEVVALFELIANIYNIKNHHPDICMGYDYLNLKLRTHDANGISSLDVDFAKELDLF
jgi:4a-hydroxytetrahydrobiopterin dehydratase